jgi:hypothetical protein
VAQVVECLLSMCEAWSSNPNTTKIERKGRREEGRGGWRGDGRWGGETEATGALRLVDLSLTVAKVCPLQHSALSNQSHNSLASARVQRDKEISVQLGQRAEQATLDGWPPPFM